MYFERSWNCTKGRGMSYIRAFMIFCLSCMCAKQTTASLHVCIVLPSRECSANIWRLIFSVFLFLTFCSAHEVNSVIIGRFNRFCTYLLALPVTGALQDDYDSIQKTKIDQLNKNMRGYIHPFWNSEPRLQWLSYFTFNIPKHIGICVHLIIAKVYKEVTLKLIICVSRMFALRYQGVMKNTDVTRTVILITCLYIFNVCVCNIHWVT